MKRICFLLSVLLPALISDAQSLKVDGDVMKFEANILAGLNTDGWEVSFGAACFPVEYVGFKANIGFAGEIEELGDWGKDELETGHHYASRFKFVPSVVFRSPRLVYLKNQDAGLYLFAETGIVLSPGASGSKGAKVFNRDFKCGINLQIDRGVVFIGYGCSDFNLYSGFPDNHWGQPDRDNYITHSGFIGVAYKF